MLWEVFQWSEKFLPLLNNVSWIFVTFILLKTKSNSREVVEKPIAQIERDTGNTAKLIWEDNASDMFSETPQKWVR